MLTYGDGVADVNVPELARFHRESGRIATLTGVHPVGRFGELAVDGSAVRSFAEKTGERRLVDQWRLFVLNRRVFDYLTATSASSNARRSRALSLDGSLASIAIPATGSAWTRSVTWRCSTNSGPVANPRGGSGQTNPDHRASWRLHDLCGSDSPGRRSAAMLGAGCIDASQEPTLTVGGAETTIVRVNLEFGVRC